MAGAVANATTFNASAGNEDAALRKDAMYGRRVATMSLQA
jgi:hypothetical protein